MGCTQQALMIVRMIIMHEGFFFLFNSSVPCNARKADSAESTPAFSDIPLPPRTCLYNCGPPYRARYQLATSNDTTASFVLAARSKDLDPLPAHVTLTPEWTYAALLSEGSAGEVLCRLLFVSNFSEVAQATFDGP